MERGQVEGTLSTSSRCRGIRELPRDKGSIRVLDLGCGAGRHTLILANDGFQVTGLDVSETALKKLQRHVDSAGLKNVVLARHEMSELPFVDEYFDAVVSTNVLHHGTVAEINRTLSELFRIMKGGGAGFVITLSRRDFRYGDGENIEPDTYRFTEGDEKGIVHHFFDEIELCSFFNRFEIMALHEELFPAKEGNWAHFHLRMKKA